MKIPIRKNVITAFMVLFLFGSFTSSAFAAPSFSLSPINRTLSGGGDYEMEILIDSDGEDIIKARAVIVYDPTYVQIVKAERNNKLFKQFPEDEQTTDNTNGVIMLTGFTQSGSGELYNTSGEPDLFARVTFKPLWDGQVTYDFEFSGDDKPFNSVMIADGSPPQNILNTKPTSAVITLINVPREGTGSDAGIHNGNTGASGNNNLPVSGIFDENQFIPGLIGIIGGVMLFIGSGILYQISQKMRESKYRTVVDLDNDEN